MDTIETGTYVANQGNYGQCIAIDEYSISKISDGFLVESNNTIFGTNGFQQKAELITDFHWKMQELNIHVESLNNELHVSVNEGKVYVHQKKQDTVFKKNIDLQHKNYFFIYSGALIIPMIWLRGFDFDNCEKVTYQMLPVGFADIKQIPDTVSSNNMREFSVLMYVRNFTDIIKIRTDVSGKLLSLHSVKNQLTIKKQQQ